MGLVKCKECQAEISKKAKQCPKCGTPAKKKTSIVTWLVLVLIVLWGVGIMNSDDYRTASTRKYESGKETRKPTPLEEARMHTDLEFEWRKGGFDNVMKADFTISNNSNHNIKDIEITCTNYAKSGTQLDRNKRTIYDVINSLNSKKFEKFNMGFIHSQVDSTICNISDLKIAG